VRSLFIFALGALRALALPDSCPETITEVRAAGNPRKISGRQPSERPLSRRARDIVDAGVRVALAPCQA
jgi:hypothetical protein